MSMYRRTAPLRGRATRAHYVDMTIIFRLLGPFLCAGKRVVRLSAWVDGFFVSFLREGFRWGLEVWMRVLEYSICMLC